MYKYILLILALMLSIQIGFTQDHIRKGRINLALSGNVSFDVNRNILSNKGKIDLNFLGGYTLHPMLNLQLKVGSSQTFNEINNLAPSISYEIDRFLWTLTPGIRFYPIPNQKFVPFLSLFGGPSWTRATFRSLNPDVEGGESSMFQWWVEGGGGISYFLSDRIALEMTAVYSNTRWFNKEGDLALINRFTLNGGIQIWLR